MYQNSRCPEEKQEVTINYIFLYSLGIVTHSYQGLVGTLLKFEFPDASQRSALQAGLPKDRNLRPTIITLYCTLHSAAMEAGECSPAKLGRFDDSKKNEE